jgi:cytochrome P450
LGARFSIKTVGRPPLVFLSDPEDVKAMFLASADLLRPGEGGHTIEPIVGASSFMLLDQEEHLNGRREVLPAFQASALQRHISVVAEVTHRGSVIWPRGTDVALHPLLRVMTLEIILRTMLGPGTGSLDDSHSLLRDCLLGMLSVTASAVFPEPLLRHGPGRATWRAFLRQRAAVDQLIYAIIDDRQRSEHHNGDLLDRLLRAHNPDGSPYSPRQVRDNLMSIVLAGHETTASQLAWAFQLLAHNPRVQQRLIEELDAGTADEYLSATVKEILRQRPVFLFAIPRAVKQPIEIGGWIYRPPAHLLACIYLLHHDPAIYPDPQVFRPERFLETSPRQPAPLAWGGGRKRCPGSHLATHEIETVLRIVLEQATVEPVADHIERPRWRSVIVTPHAGCRVILRPRASAARRVTRH